MSADIFLTSEKLACTINGVLRHNLKWATRHHISAQLKNLITLGAVSNL